MQTLNEQSYHYELIKKAIVYIDEHYNEQPNIDELANYVGLSSYHFSRVFKAYVGITPMQFLKATTLEHAKEKLSVSRTVLDVSQELGLSSSSRLHELFVNFIAATPNEYKTMGLGLKIVYGVGYSPYGKAMIASTSKGICALEFIDERCEHVVSRLKTSWKNAAFEQNDEEAQDLLDNIFIQKKKTNLHVKGTNFQIAVWKALLNIPKGAVITYSDVAHVLNKPSAVRAVSTAIASNHIAILIPCHRVISKSAAMAGYRWGIDRKKIILAHEELSLE